MVGYKHILYCSLLRKQIPVQKETLGIRFMSTAAVPFCCLESVICSLSGVFIISLWACSCQRNLMIKEMISATHLGDIHYIFSKLQTQ